MNDTKISAKSHSRTFTPLKVIDDRHVLQIGKYKCQTIEEIIEIDPSYISWLRTKPWAYNNEPLMAIIKDIQAPDLIWGKHKGRSLEWVMSNDENYMKFLYNSDYVRTKCPELKAKIDQIYI